MLFLFWFPLLSKETIFLNNKFFFHPFFFYFFPFFLFKGLDFDTITFRAFITIYPFNNLKLYLTYSPFAKFSALMLINEKINAKTNHILVIYIPFSEKKKHNIYFSSFTPLELYDAWEGVFFLNLRPLWSLFLSCSLVLFFKFLLVL